MYLATKEDHTLTSCLKVILVNIFILFINSLYWCFIICSSIMILSTINNNLNSAYIPLNILQLLL